MKFLLAVLIPGIFFSLFAITPLHAHGDHNHNNHKSQPSEKHSSSPPSLPSLSAFTPDSPPISAPVEIPAYPSPETLTLEDFPTLHPMVVHFPIALYAILPLLVAIYGFFRIRNKFSSFSPMWWALILIASGGVISAWIAYYVVHPHIADDVLPVVREVLERHEDAARWAVILGIAGWGALILEPFLGRVLSWIALIVWLSASIAIFIAGHWGGALVHVYGVGPAGAGLEVH